MECRTPWKWLFEAKNLEVPKKKIIGWQYCLVYIVVADHLLYFKFMTMMAHLVLCITIMLGRDANVKACLPFEYSAEDYNRKDVELLTGLSVAIGLLSVEFLGFFSGLTMFSASVGLFSTLAHATASVAMAYFALDVWDCHLYWWIFSTCSALPALVEIFIMIGMLGLKKSI